jgi:hypothetical protein
MDESKRLVVQFLEKEIKTYTALALFLSRVDVKSRVVSGDTGVVYSASFYKDRMKEAKTLVSNLKELV